MEIAADTGVPSRLQLQPLALLAGPRGRERRCSYAGNLVDRPILVDVLRAAAS